MQIIFLPKGWMITLFFILWILFQASAAFFCSKIPDQYLSPQGFVFKERKWEKSVVLYEKGFKVRKWKRFLPDGSAFVKGGYRKKYLTDYSKENLERFLIESSRAEFQHILSIFPFWAFGLFSPPIVIVYMFLYALMVNMPCIIVQRYNRQRLLKVLEKLYIA